MIPRLMLALGVVCLAAAAWVRQSAPAFPTSARTHHRPSGGRPGSDEDRLWFSIDALRDVTPDLSADRTLSQPQRRGAIVAVAVLVLALLLWLKGTLIFVLGLTTVLYLASMLLRVRLFHLALNGRGIIRITDACARSVADTELPSYSVLVPAFREPE